MANKKLKNLKSLIMMLRHAKIKGYQQNPARLLTRFFMPAQYTPPNLKALNHFSPQYMFKPAADVFKKPVLYMFNTPFMINRPKKQRLKLMSMDMRKFTLHTDKLIYLQNQFKNIASWGTQAITYHRISTSLRTPATYELPSQQVENLRELALYLNISQDEMILMWFYLKHKQVALLTQYWTYIFNNTILPQQRNTFYNLCELLELYLRLPHINDLVSGIYVILTGKINRAGSARKAKLAWRKRAVYQSRKSVPVLYAQSASTTSTGSLGITQYISYKDRLRIRVRLSGTDNQTKQIPNSVMTFIQKKF